MEQWIFWIEELSREANDLVGKKCANLGELSRIGVRVPPGFAISVRACEEFMNLTKATEDLQNCVVKVKDQLSRVETCLDMSCEAREIVESKPMPAHMEQTIRRYYRELCERAGKKDVPVAVRSSGSVSMPGQMETYLNVVGEESVVSHVKKVWGSVYTARAIMFRLSKDLPLDWAPIGVAVLVLVDAKAAGVALTVLPTTGDTGKIIIEGNWGLGESVVSGEMTPDSFTVDKASMAIVERRIVCKTTIVKKGASGTSYEPMVTELCDKPCLEDEEIMEIARVSLQVEGHFGVPQDMEWVVDAHLPRGSNIYWVQARPARYVKAEKTDDIDYLIDLMVRIFK